MRFAHLSSNGMITIPKNLREELDIREDTLLFFEARNGELVMKKVGIVDDSVIRKMVKKYGIKKKPTEEILKEMREIRREVYKEEYG